MKDEAQSGRSETKRPGIAPGRILSWQIGPDQAWLAALRPSAAWAAARRAIGTRKGEQDT